MRSRRGFTLIEVLVALFILTGAIIVIASAWSGNFMRIRKSTMYNNVASLLERKMVETESRYKEKPIAEIPEEDSGDFGNDFPDYTWTMKSRELKLPDLTPLLVSKEEAANETLISMIKQMTEFLNKAIKEVKITVKFKVKKREVEFTATQYFVDYDKEFSLGGGGAR
jgi:general secretion pathway protein I